MRTRGLAAVVILSLIAEVAVAAEFWEKKPYQQWSKSETERMLTNSPWAQRVTLGGLNINVSQRNQPNPAGTLGAGNDERESTPRITYTAQLRSAAVLRQAVIRDSQFDIKYDRLTPQQRARFDAQATQYIDSRDEGVVVYVTFESNVQSFRIELHKYWGRQTLDLLKPTTYLNVAGRKLALIDFMMSGDEAFQLVFERPQNPPSDATLGVEFQAPRPAGDFERLLLQFKLAKMLVDGSPQY